MHGAISLSLETLIVIIIFVVLATILLALFPPIAEGIQNFVCNVCELLIGKASILAGVMSAVEKITGMGNPCEWAFHCPSE